MSTGSPNIARAAILVPKKFLANKALLPREHALNGNLLPLIEVLPENYNFAQNVVGH